MEFLRGAGLERGEVGDWAVTRRARGGGDRECCAAAAVGRRLGEVDEVAGGCRMAAFATRGRARARPGVGVGRGGFFLPLPRTLVLLAECCSCCCWRTGDDGGCSGYWKRGVLCCGTV